MKTVLASSLGIAAAALCAGALSAEPAKNNGALTDVIGDRSVVQGSTEGERLTGEGDRKPNEMNAIRMAQVGSPAAGNTIAQADDAEDDDADDDRDDDDRDDAEDRD